MKRFLTLLTLIKSDISLLRTYLFDSRISWKIKGLIIGMLIYVVVPLDIIADVVPLLGQVDDLVVIVTVVSWIKQHIPKKTMDEVKGKVIEGK